MDPQRNQRAQQAPQAGLAERAERAERDRKFESLVQQAIEAMRADRNDEVRRLLQEAMATGPQSPIAPFLLASHFAQQREYDRAEGLFIHTLNLAPDFLIARFQLGLLQLTSARPAAAIATWGPLELLDEGHTLRLFRDGLQAMAGDQFEQAKALLRRGIEGNQENLPLNRDMQMVIEAIEANQANEANEKEDASPPENGAVADGQPGTPDSSDDAGKLDRSGTMQYLLSRYRKQ